MWNRENADFSTGSVPLGVRFSGSKPGLPVTAPGVAGGRRSGFLLPMVVLGILAIAFMISTLSTLSQGARTAVHHSNNRQICFQIAYSGYSRLLAKFHMKPWSQRPCSLAPYQEKNVALFGGSYDVWVENTPGKADQVDLSVLSRYAGKQELYFWRVRCRDDLLSLSGRFQPVVFTSGNADAFPGKGGSGVGEHVNKVLADRVVNRAKAEDCAARLTGERSVKDVAAVLAARPPKEPPPSLGAAAPPVRIPTPLAPPPPLPTSGNTAGTLLADLPSADKPLEGPPTGNGNPTEIPASGGYGTGTGTGTGTGVGTGTGAGSGTGTGTFPGHRIYAIFPHPRVGTCTVLGAGSSKLLPTYVCQFCGLVMNYSQSQCKTCLETWPTIAETPSVCPNFEDAP